MIREIMASLVAKGCCVMLATHDLDEAQRVAQRVVVLHRGVVVLNDSMNALCSGGKRLEDIVREATR
jgi:ABC-type multidrug transport system ATPase subunit